MSDVLQQESEADIEAAARDELADDVRRERNNMRQRIHRFHQEEGLLVEGFHPKIGRYWSMGGFGGVKLSDAAVVDYFEWRAQVEARRVEAERRRAQKEERKVAKLLKRKSK